MLDKLNNIQGNVQKDDQIKLCRDINFLLDIEETVTHDEFRIFTQFNFSEEKILPHGFKIHISATPDNYLEILRRVHGIAEKYKTTFKYISNKDYFLFNISDKEDRIFSGKFITLYPNSYDIFLELIPVLFESLKEFEGPKIMTDKSYKGSIVHYRYGLFEFREDRMMYFEDGYTYKDDPMPIYQLPPNIHEPFSFDEEKPKIIGERYKVVEAIQFKNSGGVYMGIRVDTGEKVLIKEARPYIYQGEREAISFRKHEADFLKANKIAYFPKYIDSFFDCGHFFLVVEYIEGMTLLEERGAYQNDSDILAERVKDLIYFLDEIHKQKIYLGDISYLNIMVDTDKNLKFIDTEHSGINIEKEIKIFYKTKGFYDDSIFSLSLFSQDIKQMGYLLLSLVSRANMFTCIDKTGETSIEFLENSYEYLKIPQDIKRLIVYLLIAEEMSISTIRDKFEKGELLDYQIKKRKKHRLLDLVNCFENNVRNHKFYYSNIRKSKMYSYFYGESGLLLKDITFEHLVMLDVKTTRKVEDNMTLCDYENQDVNIIIQKIEDLLLHKKDFSLYYGVLGHLYTLMLVSSNDNQVKSYMEKVISQDIVPMLNLEKFPYSLEMEYGSKRWSYYVDQGSGGLLKVLIKYAITFKSKVFDSLIEGISNQLVNINYTQNATYDSGLAGIADLLIDAYLYTGNSQYLNAAKYKIIQISSYIIKVGEEYAVPSPDFQNIGMEFGTGTLGIVYVYNRLNKILEGLYEVIN